MKHSTCTVVEREVVGTLPLAEVDQHDGRAPVLFDRYLVHLFTDQSDQTFGIRLTIVVLVVLERNAKLIAGLDQQTQTIEIAAPGPSLMPPLHAQLSERCLPDKIASQLVGVLLIPAEPRANRWPWKL